MKIRIAVGLLLLGIIGVACTNNEQAPQEKPVQMAQKRDCNAVFQANCAMCHNPNRDAVGPVLKGALGRWNNDTARIKSFIRNSGKMIADGDPRATELYNKWKASMTAFPDISDADMNCLIEMMK